ncbi:MAG: response regulator [Planctomycetes bacterium]|nr:response regulator [Planctomycetota bacterium]
MSDPATILVVDDDPDFLDQMRVKLGAAGFKVLTAAGEREARALADSGGADLAVVDLMMGGADGGFSLCHYVKNRRLPLPVILVTAVTSETGLEFDSATPEERSWVKADAFLAKPVRVDQLVREIRRLLKG